MKVMRIALTVSAMLGVSGPVMAQSVQVHSLRSVQAQVASGNYYGQSDNVRWTNDLEGVEVARPTPVQFARARKAAALINANRCADAYQLAVKAKDDKLASRVEEVCAPRS
ncbi:hypothetical protein ASD21_09210 [Caulobacter sp. Root1455]|uniref:hypothetical protein n=1 Tax=unclassified Caulobacter TaxID=2648921 RepID=UPI0006FA2132|nr:MULTISPECIES: hypothetical protein [unclassified Caulobacter]KQY27768.1 hypothetical protein ASD38_17910 [Caulobacter sp. Root487D2Y]KQY93764.1 hypothetical protein ASD21_09210 [Caulobacter sp. Root1455]